MEQSTREWRTGAGWFGEHYEDAATQVIDFFEADGITMAGVDVADVGCGDGIIDLGVCLRSGARSVVGFDLLDVDTVALASMAQRHAGLDLPPNLSFRSCGPTSIPAPDESFDRVFSWSAFEHVLDPVHVLREVHRVLRPGGVLMIQLWPFYYSQHGSHLWEWSPEGFVQLLDGRQDDVEREVRAQQREDAPWAEERIRESRTLNRLTLDELHRSLLAGGFDVSKLELLTNAFHIPRELSRYPLSALAIAGAKLLANRL